MVFVPRLTLTRGLLGLDTAVARAVPADLLVAPASRLVPADLVQKLLLAAVFVGAAAGAARPCPRTRWRPGRPRPRCTPGTRSCTSVWSWATGACSAPYATPPLVARAAIDLRPSGARPRTDLAVAAPAAPPAA